MKRTKKKVVGDSKPKVKHEVKKLTEEEVIKNRSNAYDFLDVDKRRKCDCWLVNDLCYCDEEKVNRNDWYNKSF